VEKTLLVSNEDELVARFGRPTNLNAETFFSAASFLAYGNRLHVSRAARTVGNTATFTVPVESGNTTVLISNTTGIGEGFLVFGDAFDDGTIVDSVNSTAIQLNKAPLVTGTEQFIVADDNFAFNAIANSSGFADLSTAIVKNEEHFDQVKDGIDSNIEWVAKYPGAIGNSLKISVCDTPEAFESSIDLDALLAELEIPAGHVESATIEFVVGSNTATVSVVPVDASDGDHTSNCDFVASSLVSLFAVGDRLRAGRLEIGGVESLKVTALRNENVSVEFPFARVIFDFETRYTLGDNFTSSVIDRTWEFFGAVENAPGQSVYQLQQGNTAALDEVHVVVSDENGRISGVPGTILEVFQGLSRATDSKTLDGASNYYQEVINKSSKFVWAATDYNASSPSASASDLTSSSVARPITTSFIGGRDSKSEGSIAVGDLVNAYNQFQSAEVIDVSLLIAGKARGGERGEALLNYLIDNVAERRKDCVVFGSPRREDVVDVVSGDVEQRVVNFRNSLRSSSYAVLDSGYKYMYDKYNDTFRHIPLNGDIAGLAARTDDERDAWFSPAGFNRGQIRNVVRLSFNPTQSQRDVLYKNGVNPVVTFPGQGTVMFGDKTLLARPSAFDRINVRRLFIVLEKAIATSAKFTLFEFNDEFTRASFVNLVTPFLRDVQGRRGIFDFLVVCDETNNTGEIIDRNEFVGDIYIKPARSINFIQLNFVAVRTGVEFSEIIGNF
jgi:phage tail sheath protein FI